MELRNLEGFASSIKRNKKYLFYLLLFIPLIWYLMEDRQWPIYGITALLIMALGDERQAIRLEGKKNFVGGLFVILSFLTPFLKPYFGVEARFTSLEYAIYLFGFVVIFYGVSAVRNFLPSMVFLVAVSIFLHLSEYFEYFFNGLIPILMYIVVGLLNFSGVTTSFQNNILTVQGSKSFTAYIAPSCAGVQSIFIFSLVLIFLLSNIKISFLQKIILTLIGFIGTFLINAFRIYLITLVGTQWSLQTVDLFHSVIGYFLFIAWILFLEYVALNRLQPAAETLKLRSKV